MNGTLAGGSSSSPRRVPEGWPHGYRPPTPPDSEDDSEDEEEQPEPPAKVPFKFPLGAQLRPWACMYFKDERLSFQGTCISALFEGVTVTPTWRVPNGRNEFENEIGN